jgi:hypothetical protein
MFKKGKGEGSIPKNISAKKFWFIIVSPGHG